MLKSLLIIMIEIYRQAVSPYLGPRCRFFPNCSVYMKEAIQMHGPSRGVMRGLRRLLKCHPWGGQGFDPVK